MKHVPELPRWAADFNAGKPADAWLGREWRALGEGGAVLGRMPETPGPAYIETPSGSSGETLVEILDAASEGRP